MNGGAGRLGEDDGGGREKVTALLDPRLCWPFGVGAFPGGVAAWRCFPSFSPSSSATQTPLPSSNGRSDVERSPGGSDSGIGSADREYCSVSNVGDSTSVPGGSS